MLSSPTAEARRLLSPPGARGCHCDTQLQQFLPLKPAFSWRNPPQCIHSAASASPPSQSKLLHLLPARSHNPQPTVSSITEGRLCLSPHTSDIFIPQLKGFLALGLIQVLDPKLRDESQCAGAGTLPAFLAQMPNMRNIDLKNNRLSAMEAPYASGRGLPTNSSLLNFRVSFNNIRVRCHSAPATSG